MPFEVLNKQIKITRDDILAELNHSLQSKNAIGIFVKDTHDLITTAVIDIAEDQAIGDYVISLLDHDLHGYPVERTRLLLNNIDKVIHFSISFDDPQYVKERRKAKFKA
jgi:hypothetical protein